MNHPDAARRARHKPWQLRLAQRCGLPVPATLITTFPQAARDFAERFPDLVVKPVSGSAPAGARPGGAHQPCRARHRLHRRRVRPDAAAAPDRQDGRHPAHRRRRPDAGRPQGGRTGRATPTRWTSVSRPPTAPWRPVDVPPRAAEAVRTYLREAELSYGAFDFAEDADGTSGGSSNATSRASSGSWRWTPASRSPGSVAEWLAHEEPGAGTRRDRPDPGDTLTSRTTHR